MKKLIILILIFFLSVLILIKQVKAQDTIPPANITDLKAYRTFYSLPDRLILQWTSPGDDGNIGTASSYDIRYSTSLITEANWNSTTRVNVTITPSPAGTKESFLVTGLTNNTTYYFAIKTADEVPNWSNLSNIASNKTLPAVISANGSAKAIQEAVNKVAASGGSVYIPEGTFNFHEVEENWTTVEIPAGVNIYGAKTERDANGQVIEWKTIIRLPWDAGTNGSAWFRFTGNADPTKPSRFSDIKLIGYRSIDPNSTKCHNSVVMRSVANFRIDHCYFENVACGIQATSAPEQEWTPITSYGVIDHCYLVNTHGYPAPSPGTVGYGVYPSRGYGDFWEGDVSKVLGKYTNYTVFIEDSYFEKWRHVTAANSGAHYVIRNSIIKDDFGYGSIDAHGWFQTTCYNPQHGTMANPTAVYNETLGVWVHDIDNEPLGGEYFKITQVGTRAVEIYNNQIVDAIQYPWATMIRGGSGVAFNNIFGNGTYRYFMYFSNEARPEGSKVWSKDWWVWNNTMLNDTQEIIKYDPDNQIIENISYFRHAPHTFNYTPYPYPHPLTLEAAPAIPPEPKKVTISERLTDINGSPIMANISIGSITNATDAEGKYIFTIPVGVHDILFNMANFFIENFWLKLLTVNISSINYSKLTHITSYAEQKNISMIFNVTNNQTIQSYSPEKPKRVLQNSTILMEYNSTSDLIANYGWFYNETEKILYIKFNETIG